MAGSFSVVVPCYNYGRYLRECLNSVLMQGVDVAVRIIDDASEDDTPIVARQLASEDARVSYQRHTKNSGHIATYNEGLLGWARGTYSVLLSADDVLAPDALRRARDVLDANPEAVMLYGQAVDFCDTPPAIAARSVPEVRIRPGLNLLAERCVGTWNPIATPTVVVRTAAQQAVGGYRPELPHTADLEMWLRLAVHGSVAELTGSVQAFRRVHGSNMSHAFFRELLADERQLQAAYESFFGHITDDFVGREQLRRACRSGLAERGIWCGYRALRERRVGDVLECLRFAVCAWHGWRESEIRRFRIPDVVPPLSHALQERRRRRWEARRSTHPVAAEGRTFP